MTTSFMTDIYGNPLGESYSGGLLNGSTLSNIYDEMFEPNNFKTPATVHFYRHGNSQGEILITGTSIISPLIGSLGLCALSRPILFPRFPVSVPSAASC